VIKTDIRKVLDRMQVQYRPTKTGFECIHLPSIDISSLGSGGEPRTPATPNFSKTSRHRKHPSNGSHESSGTTTRKPTRKTSKLSFGVGRKDRSAGAAGGDEAGSIREKEMSIGGGRPSTSGASAMTGTGVTTQSSGSSSFFNVSSNNHTVMPEQSNLAEDAAGAAAEEDSTTAEGKTLPPLPREVANNSGNAIPPSAPPQAPPLPTGEVDRVVFDTIGQNTLAVRFEINIVKVPWLPLHGLQFRRASGDGWQYQMMARRVLTELKL
jgi:serine/threonine protein kinase KIN1/2